MVCRCQLYDIFTLRFDSGVIDIAAIIEIIIYTAAYVSSSVICSYGKFAFYSFHIPMVFFKIVIIEYMPVCYAVFKELFTVKQLLYPVIEKHSARCK